MNQPTFVASIDAKSIYAILKEAEVGAVVPYKVMSEAIGRNVRNGARGAMETARKMAQRELGFVFGVIPKEGLRRLTEVEKVGSGAQFITKIRRAAQRGIDRQRTVKNPEALPPEIKVRSFVYESVLGMVASSMQEKKINKIEAKVQQTQASLPLAKTLEAFKD